MKALTLSLTVLATSLVTGCSWIPFYHKSPKAELCKEPVGYSQAIEGTNLHIPAGLEAPDTRNALRIPDLATPAPPARTKDQGCLDSPPNYTIVKPKEPEA
jgi:uncharacterized lipoprotein